MADRDFASEVLENTSAKNLRDEAHSFVGMELFAIGSYDPGALLTAVLEGV
jgi:hypothetical protein